MPTQAIEEFARALVRYVRDKSVHSCDQLLRTHAASTIAKRWKEVADRNGGESIRVIIPDSIDETIFQLLDAIDQGLLPLSFTSSNGTIVNLAEEGMGELAGWYMSSGGWRGLYSNERVHDDFSDLDPGSKS